MSLATKSGPPRWPDNARLISRIAPGKDPSMTFAASIANAEYLNQNQSDVHAHLDGLNVKYFEASAHSAFKG